MATDGWLSEEEERERMKSEIIERWEGSKIPYQMMLTGILPERIGPLWYFSCEVRGWNKEVSFLVPNEVWKREKTKKIFRMKCALSRVEAICVI